MKRGLLWGVMMFAMACTAQAQQPGQQPSMQLSYQEAVPAGGDLVAVRAKIFARIESDCAAAAKALGRQCVINTVNFNDWRGRNPALAGPAVHAIAHVTLVEATKPDADQK